MIFTKGDIVSKELSYEARTAIRALEAQIDDYNEIISRLRKEELTAVIVPELDPHIVENYIFLPNDGHKLYPPFRPESKTMEQVQNGE